MTVQERREPYALTVAGAQMSSRSGRSVLANHNAYFLWSPSATIPIYAGEKRLPPHARIHFPPRYWASPSKIQTPRKSVIQICKQRKMFELKALEIHVTSLVIWNTRYFHDHLQVILKSIECMWYHNNMVIDCSDVKLIVHITNILSNFTDVRISGPLF